MTILLGHTVAELFPGYEFPVPIPAYLLVLLLPIFPLANKEQNVHKSALKYKINYIL